MDEVELVLRDHKKAGWEQEGKNYYDEDKARKFAAQLGSSTGRSVKLVQVRRRNEMPLFIVLLYRRK